MSFSIIAAVLPGTRYYSILLDIVLPSIVLETMVVSAASARRRAAAAEVADANDDDGWRYPVKRAYQPYMVELMSWFHVVQYEADKRFTREELLELTPLTIKRWFKDITYGDPEYNTDEVERPENVYLRSSSLEMRKKAVSFFMPNKAAPWVNGQGNPTRSGQVNDVIRTLKKYEVRGVAVESQDKRPLTQPEFLKTLDILKGVEDIDHKLRYPLMALTQHHIITRVDDCCELKVDGPRGHDRFPFALQLKVRWSKNVLEERDCPDQIMLASMNNKYCWHIHLAQYLETYLEIEPDAHFLFTPADVQDKRAVKNLIGRYSDRLRELVFSNEEFRAIYRGTDSRGLGTHSVRKAPATFAAGCGATLKEIEKRGRWKSDSGQTVTFYVDLEDQYTDAKVAGMLCVGGPCSYRLRDGVDLSNEWLFEKVVPNIRRRFPGDGSLCRCLALALLHAALDHDLADGVENGTCMRIRNAYFDWQDENNSDSDSDSDSDDGAKAVGPNPVVKVPLAIYRIQDTLMIDELEDGVGGNGGDGSAAAARSVSREEHQQVLLQLQQLQRQQHSNHQQAMGSISSLRQYNQAQFSQLNNK